VLVGNGVVCHQVQGACGGCYSGAQDEHQLSAKTLSGLFGPGEVAGEDVADERAFLVELYGLGREWGVLGVFDVPAGKLGAECQWLCLDGGGGRAYLDVLPKRETAIVEPKETDGDQFESSDNVLAKRKASGGSSWHVLNHPWDVQE